MQFSAFRKVKHAGGWQMWATMPTEQPISPVVETAEELAEWCAKNTTVFAKITADRDTWLQFIRGEEDLPLQIIARN